MNKEFKFNTPKELFNLFTSNEIAKYSLNNYCILNQIHSDNIIIIDENYENNTSGDAMITSKKKLPLVIKTADCLPVLVYDQKNKIIAAIHAGWKGVLNNITIKAITKMINEFHSNPKDITVYIYPSIRKCHFEIEKDVYRLFESKIKNITKYSTQKGNKYYIDLQQIVIDLVKELGISNINDSNICTYCNHNNFYSYRFNHTDKRNYLIAMIKE